MTSLRLTKGSETLLPSHRLSAGFASFTSWLNRSIEANWLLGCSDHDADTQSNVVVKAHTINMNRDGLGCNMGIQITPCADGRVCMVLRKGCSRLQYCQRSKKPMTGRSGSTRVADCNPVLRMITHPSNLNLTYLPLHSLVLTPPLVRIFPVRFVIGLTPRFYSLRPGFPRDAKVLYEAVSW